MNDFFLNSDWDIVQLTTNDGWQTVSGADAIAQNMSQRLQTIVGEWFLNLTIYLDLFGIVLNKQTPPAIIESHIKKIISQTPGFIAFQSFSIDISTLTREMTVNFKAETISGNIEYSKIIGVI